MDVIRTVMLVGLVVMLWKSSIFGVRVVKDVFHWGASYPLLLAMTVGVLLVVWGVIGEEYGLQGIFFDDNFTILFLNGLVVMLFLCYASYIASVALPHGRPWVQSVKVVSNVYVRVLGARAERPLPQESVLIGCMTVDFNEMNIIYGLACRSIRQSDWKTNRLNTIDFRLLFAPAVLSVLSVVYFALIGLVPLVIQFFHPVASGDRSEIYGRLFWLSGVLAGQFLSVFVAKLVSRKLLEVCGTSEDGVLASLKKDGESFIKIQSSADGTKLSEENGKEGSFLERVRVSFEKLGRDIGGHPARYLFAFYLIAGLVPLAFVNIFPEYYVVYKQKIEINSGRYYGLPVSILWIAISLVGSAWIVKKGKLAYLAVCCLTPLLLPARFYSASSLYVPRPALVVAGFVVIIGICYVTRNLFNINFVYFIINRYFNLISGSWTGVIAFALIAVVFAVALVTGDDAEGSRLQEPSEQMLWLVAAIMIFAVISVAGLKRDLRGWWPSIGKHGRVDLVVLAVLAMGAFLLCALIYSTDYNRFPAANFGLTVVALLLSLLTIKETASRSIGQEDRLADRQNGISAGYRPYATILGISLTLTLSLGWGVGWAMLAMVGVLVLGMCMVSNLSRSPMPGISAPICIIFSFISFSIIYNALTYPGGVGISGRLPAAFSLMWLMALIVSFHAVLNARWPQSGATAGTILLVGVLVVNGNVWNMEDNHFKMSFDSMEKINKPILIDTRAYFRDALPGAVKLRDPWKFEKRNLDLGRPDSELLGTVFFEVDKSEGTFSGDMKIRINLFDYRGKLRVREGDELYLARSEKEIGNQRAKFRVIKIEAPSDSGQLPSFGIAKLEKAYGIRIKIESQLSAYELIKMHSWKMIPSYDGINDFFEESHAYANWIVMAAPPHDGKAVLSPDNSRGLYEEMLSGSQKAFADRIKVGDCLSIVDVGGEEPFVVDVVMLSGVVGRNGGVEPDDRFRKEVVEKIDCYERGDSGCLGKKYAQTDPRKQKYRLELAQDRGFFEDISIEGTIRLKLYNGARLRLEDRIVLQNGSVADVLTNGSPLPSTDNRTVFKVAKIENSDGISERDRLVTLSPVNQNKGSEKIETFGLNGLGVWRLLGQIDSLESLRNWKGQMRRLYKKSKPKLVIVAVSGGGIRSAVWTTRVLTTLEANLSKEFAHSIRIVTGASGGMVGASYYVADFPADDSRPRGTELEAITGNIGKNQLDGVAGALVFTDIPGMLNPLPRDQDRGRRLEKLWGDQAVSTQTDSIAGKVPKENPLDSPLRGFVVDELLGLRPSLVYTPMMVEDGRRLLISNLNLTFATRSWGRMMSNNVESSITSSVNRTSFDMGQTLDDENLQLYSLSAVELFRLFPLNYDLKISSAARMSASFPWISPAVCLPTLPPRRVVDAGYYDNYGVNLAAMWLVEMKDWLVRNTSGVLIVQIRDQVSQEARMELMPSLAYPQSRSPLEELFGAVTYDVGRKIVSPGLQSVDTPLHGVSMARQWSMSFRNDEQIEMLDDLFREAVEDCNKNQPRSNFFQTVVFECPVQAALSWRLSKQESDVLKNCFPMKPTDEKVLRAVNDGLSSRLETLDKTRKNSTSYSEYNSIKKGYYEQALAELGFNEYIYADLDDAVRLYGNYVANLRRFHELHSWWKEADSARKAEEN